MSNNNGLEKDVIEILEYESKDSDLFEFYTEEVSKGRYTNREFDALMNFVQDGFEFYMELNARAKEDEVIYQLIRMKAADFVLADRELERDLSDRDYKEAKQAASDAFKFLEAMEADRDRGRGRGRGRGRDRDDEARGGGYGRGFTSSRDSRDSGRGRSSGRARGGREERDTEDRSARRKTRGRHSGGDDTQFGARRAEKQAGPVVIGEGNQLDALRTQLSGRQDQLPAEMPAPVENTRGPRGFERKVDAMPSPEEVNTAPAAKMMYQQEPAPVEVEESTEVRTRKEWLDAGFDVENEDFIAELPERPYDFTNPSHLPFFYEPDAKRPKWSCSPDGYKTLTFREVDMNYDDAIIPDFGRPKELTKGIKTAVALLKGTAAPHRYRPLEVAADVEHQRSEFNREMQQWEEENAGKPEEERSEKPMLILEGHEVNYSTIHAPAVVSSFSLNETRVKVAATLAELGAEGAASTNVEVDARQLELVYQSHDDAEFIELVESLRLFSQSAASETTPYRVYHERLLALRGQIPTALWIAINTRMTKIVNDTLRGNLGIPAEIEDFSTDGLTFVGELQTAYGQNVLERFDKYGREMFRQFHFVTFKPSNLEGLPDRCVYFMERQHLLYMPFSAPELGVMTPVGYSNTQSRVGRVTRAASPMLHKALLGFTNQESSTDAHYGIARKIILGDGTVLELFRSWYDPAESEYLVRVAKG